MDLDIEGTISATSILEQTTAKIGVPLMAVRVQGG